MENHDYKFDQAPKYLQWHFLSEPNPRVSHNSQWQQIFVFFSLILGAKDSKNILLFPAKIWFFDLEVQCVHSNNFDCLYP